MTTQSPDPRAQAVASYLRERAAAFSLSADETEHHHVAIAGMALLDAAEAADMVSRDDVRLARLDGAGRLAWSQDGTATYVESDQARRVIQGPLSGDPMTGTAILDALLGDPDE